LILIAGSVLLVIGAALLFAGAAYIREVATVLGFSAALDAVCGGVVESNPAGPMLFRAGAIASLVAGGLVIASVRRKRRWAALSVGLAIAASLTAGYAYERYTYALTRAVPPSGEFAWLNPPREMPNFILRNTEGGLTELRDLRGKAVLMFFGYAHCPDICPTTLADYKRVKRELGPQASQVAFVFVSVDGARDDPAFLRKYIALFDGEFVGLTAHPSVVSAIERDYGGAFRIDTSSADGSYRVIHTADSYLLDAAGRWRAVLPIDMQPDAIVLQIRAVLDVTSAS
jgi:protein SCO1/2